MRSDLQFDILLQDKSFITCKLWGEKSGEQTIFKIDDIEAFENGEANIQLIEGHSYEYELPAGYTLGNHELIKRSNAHPNVGRIVPNIYVGTLSLNIYLKGNQCGTLVLEVQSQKTSYRDDYRIMLEDITERATDLVLLHSSPVTQNLVSDFDSDPKTLYQRFAFIKSILESDEFGDALHKVFSSPVTKWVATEIEKDIRSFRRFDNKTIRQISSCSNRMSLRKEHHLVQKQILKSVPQKILGFHNKESIDTPENRFIKFALDSFLELVSKIKLLARNNSRLKTEATVLEGKLEQYLGHAIFKEIFNLDTIPFNSPVLQRKEGYREVFRSWLMFDLAAKLIWRGGEDVYAAGKRDIATLYEYWLFFKLLDVIKDLFRIESKELEQLIKPTSDDLGLQLKQGNHIAINGVYKNEVRDLNIQFNFNRTFSGKNEYPNSGSWTKSMRPDYTLSIWPEGIDQDNAETEELIVHIHFDAKYKLERIADILGDDTDEYSDDLTQEVLTSEKTEELKGNFKRGDLLKMHAYKDAIRRTGGAYVLYPGKNEDAYQTKGFHEVLPGLGAFAIRPDKFDDGTLALKGFLTEVVKHFLNRASQREKTAFRAYEIHKNKPNNEVRERLPEAFGINRDLQPDDTYVLIGYYQDKQRGWINEHRLYNTRTRESKGTQVLDVNLASVKYLLLHGPNETITNQLYKVKMPGLNIFSKQNLIERGYPDPSQDFYLVYDFEEVKEQELKNIKWDITLLDGYKTNRNSALPFTASLSELMAVKVK